jgi:hypothetical protein
MLARRLIRALPAALLLAAASAPTHANARLAPITDADQTVTVCADGSSATHGCTGDRCHTVEGWVGARTTGPTFPTTCRPVASIARRPIG